MAMELGRGFGKASACMAEEGERFHGLPPLKRFKILEKERQSVMEKRDKDVGPPPEVHVRCLPAKKRVCALEDFTMSMSMSMSMSMADEEKENEVKLAKKKREQSCPSAPHILQQVSNRQVSIGTEPAEECMKRKDDAHNDGDGGDDDGIFCDVCKGSDAEPSDPIVFCDGCNVMVHVSCYGYPLIDGIPSGDWFCRQCESESRRRKGDKKSHADQKSSSSRTCCLCPCRSGAMKQTTGRAWAHLSCALFVPEVFYRRARDREGIECSHVPAWRWQLPCSVCSTRGEGACIQCTEVGCSSTFHVSCALDSGLTIDYRNANALTKTPAIVIAFCPSHSRQALSRSERRRFKIVPRD